MVVPLVVVLTKGNVFFPFDKEQKIERKKT